ncbi:MAG: lectin [Bryobacteraceae bacterium]
MLPAFTFSSPAQDASPKMTFFITSVGEGKGADLGGLEGADRHCQELAKAVGAGNRTWHAYLSTGASDGKPAVNARDRIGKGPWYNAKGVEVAKSVDDLHGDHNDLTKQHSLSEKGEVLNGRGDTPNQHDMLTGSQPDGTAFPGDADKTCKNWTSSGEGSAELGHHDRQGGGDIPTSWNAAHPSKGCSQANLVSTGGAGRFYCFAVN